MSFTWLAQEPLATREDIARRVHAVAQKRGLRVDATIIALMTLLVEVGARDELWCPANPAIPDSLAFPHDSLSDDKNSVGYYQQRQPWWGSVESMMRLETATASFLAALDPNYSARDAYTAGVYAQQVQRSSFPDRYARAWDTAWDIARKAGITGDNMAATGWTGDPTFLADVLSAELGDRLVIHDGWDKRGTGNGENGTNQMGPIWGVMIHHTGNARETVEHIRDGVWQTPTYFLRGPLSQCLITPDGKCHLIAVGPCNHAGTGHYPGIPANMGNTRLIGFECAWPTINPNGTFNDREPWPDPQIITMRDAAAAVARFLGYGGDRVIGHKEYSDQGKWDPGNLSMPWFRGEVDKAVAGEFKPKPEPQAPEPDPEPDPEPEPPTTEPEPQPEPAPPPPCDTTAADTRFRALLDKLIDALRALKDKVAS